jgi:hypothetical protein
MPAANVIQLRQLLKEKMPELRLGLDELAVSKPTHAWPTRFARLDDALHGGLPKGALTELVAGQRSRGSALFLHTLLRQAAGENQIVALVDGQDSFEVTQVEADILSRLLWVRCHSAEEALKATDLLLRDRNVPVVLLDLIANPIAQVRKIPATTWFRFQRIIEQTSTICLVLTPQAMVSPAQARIVLEPCSFSLRSLDRERMELLDEIKFEVLEPRRFKETGEHNSM